MHSLSSIAAYAFTGAALLAIPAAAVPSGKLDSLRPGRAVLVPELASRDLKARDTPSACEFSVDEEYWYLPYYGEDDNIFFCLGAPSNGGDWDYCSKDEYWPDSYIDELVEGVNRQATKDGWGRYSSTDHFDFEFHLTTTAIGNRDAMTSGFEGAIRFTANNCAVSDWCKQQPRRYWLKADGDVSTSSPQYFG